MIPEIAAVRKGLFMEQDKVTIQKWKSIELGIRASEVSTAHRAV